MDKRLKGEGALTANGRHPRSRVGRAILDQLINAAHAAGYDRIRLDNLEFMTAAHRLWRSSGFTDIEPYPESEIPDEHRSHCVFMERKLT